MPFAKRHSRRSCITAPANRCSIPVRKILRTDLHRKFVVQEWELVGCSIEVADEDLGAPGGSHKVAKARSVATGISITQLDRLCVFVSLCLCAKNSPAEGRVNKLSDNIFVVAEGDVSAPGAKPT